MSRRLSPGDPPRTKQRRTNSLTVGKPRLLRAALRNLRLKHGTWKALAALMGVSANSLWGISKGRDFGSMKIAVKAARLAGVPLTVLLGGKIVSADTCPTCGQVLPPK